MLTHKKTGDWGKTRWCIRSCDGEVHGVGRSASPLLGLTDSAGAGPVKWVVPAWEVLAHDRAGWRGGLKSLRVNGCE
jgi:hypothetical protein